MQSTHFTDYDIDMSSYGDGEITFQQGGLLWAIDLPSEHLREVNVVVPDDGARSMPRNVQVGQLIREWDSHYDIDYSLSPNGQQILFSARGDIFSLSGEGSIVRNLTATSSALEDHPVWSPDGQKVAYTSDASGEQQLIVRPLQGGPETVHTHFRSGYLYMPVWSPRGDQIAIHDGAHRLWLIPTKGGEPKLVAYNREHYMHETDEHDAVFSPDGRWLAYSISRSTRLRALHLYEVSTGKDNEISLPMESDYRPAFSADGKLLLFVSDRHENPVLSDRETNAVSLKSGGIYVTTLSSQTASPFALSADKSSGGSSGEGDAAASPGDATTMSLDLAATRGPASAPLTEIDFPGLIRRAVPIPIEPNRIDELEVRQNRVFYHTTPPSLVEGEFPGEKPALHVFDMITHADQVVTDDIDSFSVSSDGARVLFNRMDHWIVAEAQPGAPRQIELQLGEMHAHIDPRQEWAEMFEDAWRLERDLFVNANMNGDDWGAVHDSYAKLLPLLGTREDLTYLIGELVGEIGSSHARTGGGDLAGEPKTQASTFLGADYKLDSQTGRYQIARIYPGDNTRDLYRSPLKWPGVNVNEGDFLLAINGHELQAPEAPDALLDGMTGWISLTIAKTPFGERRTVLVKPVTNEAPLREIFWINHTREKVDAISHGRIGYIHMSDMEGLGMQQFFQQFYARLEGVMDFVPE